ncbi:putative 5'-3' exoribonuclease 2 [Paratrimastix pyriformis]|uniref:5'-3' exoribonuclease n=1 Tax=Paratrimastix pyriformis TaxID=342808 RepID=A0ABQ8UGZ1_9EUKA|nr:putative 5'-3' exoribonuclease 2 [Paratrimastix pyriformis]
MGVPSFFAYIFKKYQKCCTDAFEGCEETGDPSTVNPSDPNPNGMEFDNLYVDANGILHNCSHPGSKLFPPATEEEMFAEMFLYFDRLFNFVRPRKLIFIAIDGVAPRAKLNQQRSRRFMSARESALSHEMAQQVLMDMKGENWEVPPEVEQLAHPTFDSNVITPGTAWMRRCAQALRGYVAKRMATCPAWGHLNVIFSDSAVPGEGEHKIMDFIRRQRSRPDYDPQTRHCIYGQASTCVIASPSRACPVPLTPARTGRQDADLMHLTLATHEPNFSIIREQAFVPGRDMTDQCTICKQPHDTIACPLNQVTPVCRLCPFIFMHIWKLRQFLRFEFADLDPEADYSAQVIDEVDPSRPQYTHGRLNRYPGRGQTEATIATIAAAATPVIETTPSLPAGRQADPNAPPLGPDIGAEDEEDAGEEDEEGEEEGEEEEGEEGEEEGEEEGANEFAALADEGEVEAEGEGALPKIVLTPAPRPAQAAPTAPTDAAPTQAAAQAAPTLPATARPLQPVYYRRSYPALAPRLVPGASKRPAAHPEVTPAGTQLRFDFERIVDDFVLLCFMAGNDFVPHLPSLDIREGCVDRLLSWYKAALHRLPGYLTDSGKINFERLRYLLKALAQEEPLVFQARQERKERLAEQAQAKEDEDRANPHAETKKEAAPAAAEPIAAPQDRADPNYSRLCALEMRRRAKIRKEDERKEREGREDEDVLASLAMHEPGYTDRYYGRFFADRYARDSDVLVDGLCRSYLEGLQWVMHYYTRGCPSFGWFYPYHYAPLTSDLFHRTTATTTVSFGPSSPVTPLTQLMAVLPPTSGHCLPPAFQDLMVNPRSPIVRFYPREFGVDWDGKRYSWQAVIVLPFIDMEALQEALRPLEPALPKEDKARNQFKDALLYMPRSHPVATALAAVALTERTSPALKPQADLDAMPGTLFGGTVHGLLPHDGCAPGGAMAVPQRYVDEHRAPPGDMAVDPALVQERLFVLWWRSPALSAHYLTGALPRAEFPEDANITMRDWFQGKKRIKVGRPAPLAAPGLYIPHRLNANGPDHPSDDFPARGRFARGGGRGRGTRGGGRGRGGRGGMRGGRGGMRGGRGRGSSRGGRGGRGSRY